MNRRCADRGSAIVDFVLVGTLLTILFVAVLQLATVVHVRNTLIDCATEGARFGALADSDPAAGAVRTRTLITEDLSADYAAEVTAQRVRVGGVDTVEVRVRAPLPVLGMLATGRMILVSGHAVAESP